MSSTSPFRGHWQLDQEIDFLNHGSFGATPTVVLEHQRQQQDALESQPVRFLAHERELEPKLDRVRQAIGELVNAGSGDLVFVRNATDGVNAVLRSMRLSQGDEIVITDHGYNACNNVAHFVAERAGATVKVAEVPFPVESDEQILQQILDSFSSRTKVLLVDHVTSGSGLVLPIKKIVAAAHQQGVRVLVDGAHAPGMVDVDLQDLGAEYYTANHHKWLCGPKVSAFLYVRPDLQEEVRPTIISHGANTLRPGRGRLHSEFDWTGTQDPTPLLATVRSLEFLGSLRGGWQEHRAANRQLALAARDILMDSLQISRPAPDHMIGSMASLPLPAGDSLEPGKVDPLQVCLYQQHQIEVPVFRVTCAQTRVIRVSCQAYNSLDQYQRLADALKAERAVGC